MKKKCRKHCYDRVKPHECDACCNCDKDKFEPDPEPCYGGKEHEYEMHICDCDVCDMNGVVICTECNDLKPETL